MIEIKNNKECFVQLWQQTERTRQLLEAQYKRYCIRRVLKSWFCLQATDDFIWEVCNRCCQNGLDILPPPSLYPRPHREFLRAIVSAKLNITMCQVNLQDLDAAYSIAFPASTPLNVNKQRHPP